MTVHLIVARSRNGVIGREGQLPWKLPEDLAYFKRTTLGHSIIMGRKTWDSLGRPLPGRVNIVISRQPDWQASGAVTAHSLDQALQLAPGNDIFIIGGAQIYQLAMQAQLCHSLHVTEVDTEIDGDAYFAIPDPQQWVETSRTTFPATEERPVGFSIVIYQRASSLAH
jgi:dihydrofolate reductase